MAESTFHIQEHIVTCPRLSKANECGPDSVRLAVKQYSPRHQLPGENVKVTIVAAHANGFFKELYEPLWCRLHQALGAMGVGIVSIWMADAAFQGKSLQLNQSSQFSDVSWQDHAEDLLEVMKHFRHRMSQPIIGIGHSMGGCQIAMMSVIHRRLFSSMVLLNPAISPPELGLDLLGFENQILKRKTHYHNLEEAGVAAKKMFATWDPQVLDLFLKFGLQNEAKLGTHGPEQSAEGSQPVALVTKGYHELVNYLKPAFIHDGKLEDPTIVYQTGLTDMFHMLGQVTCSTYFLCGDGDASYTSFIRKLWAEKTSSLGYSLIPGERRRVKVELLPDSGHFLAMERPHECANALAVWVSAEATSWKEKEAMRGDKLAGLSLFDKEKLADTWMQSLKAKL